MLISVTTKKQLKKYFVLLLIGIIVLGTFVFFKRVSYPLVVELAEIQTDNYVTNLVNEAVKRILQLQQFYDEFYTYERNTDGDVVLVKANTASINQLMALAQIEVQNELNKLETQKVNLHLGAFTGNSLLADNGPVTAISIIPIGSAVSKLESYYYSKGINQTIHRLMLHIVANVKIVIPYKAHNSRVVCEIVIAEDIILGRVDRKSVV